MTVTVRHDDFMRERLADPEFAAGYLQAALDDGEPGVLLLALRRIAEARGQKSHRGSDDVARTARPQTTRPHDG